jgi:RNA polymerase sigma factor (sigma-70 family)
LGKDSRRTDRKAESRLLSISILILFNEAIVSRPALTPCHDVETLYHDHHRWLQGWLQHKVGNAFDAADLAHDAFMRLLTSEPLRERGVGDQPRALLTRIAKGLVVDRWRRRQVEQAYLQAISHLPEPQVPPPETRLIIIEALLRIEAMLASLPARTRQMFLLAQIDGLTLQQIADRTATPVITVRRHIRKALLACMMAADE